MSRCDDLAATIADTVLARPPTVGSTRLLCVDGPAGSGKTTMAAALVAPLRDRPGTTGGTSPPGRVGTIHMDGLFPGWAGLEAGMATLAHSVVAPLRADDPGRYRRYDWHRAAFAEERVVEPGGVLVVEGVGSGGSALDGSITCLVWVEAPSDVRLRRGLLRDGEQLREQWLAFRVQEDAMFARERTRERADVVVDGTRG